MRRAAKRDENEAEIVDALRAAGCDVHQISDPNGFPDLVVHRGREHWLMEVKMPGETFTPAQKRWHSTWRGPAFVVRSVDQALLIIGPA